MECGLIGLPGAGMTTLFEALVGDKARTGAGHGPRPGIGVATIPDPRLAVVARYVESRKVTPATLTFVDIPGIDVGKGSAKTGGPLAAAREMDAICQVVRCFESPGERAGRRTDPVGDIRTLEEELILADLALVEPAVDRAARPARAGDADAKARCSLLTRVLDALNEGRPARSIGELNPGDATILRSYGLISAKPVLFVANVGENDLPGASEAFRGVADHAAEAGGESIALSAKLEAELAELAEPDRIQMIEALDLSEPAIGPLARAVNRLLGLVVFYTTSPKEIRAWTAPAEASAPEAAGVVHSDMQRGFIRAECYNVEDLDQHKSEKALKAAGRLRSEGKHYRLRDGDVMRFLFNV